MLPRIALLICILLILYLFWEDRKNNEGVTKAIWVPFIWMFLSASRYVSGWLNLGTPGNNLVDSYTEGSPIDRAVFLILTIFSILILRNRKLNWPEIFRNNGLPMLYFFFGLLSILWSEYPFVSIKRWIKFLGSMNMALIVLTETRPYDALGTILKRLAFLLLPLSVLFIRYYPHLGRAFHMDGVMYTGTSMQKNGLGQICMIAGIYFCWTLLLHRPQRIDGNGQLPLSIYMIILPMIAWLLHMANSATSVACLVIAITLFLVSRMPSVALNPGRYIAIGIALLVFLGILEIFLDLSSYVIVALGRDNDLTSRVPIWNELMAMAGNPFFGVGYEVFWSGERMAQIWAKVGANIVTAHNGYLDTYLSIGLIGLFLFLATIASGIQKVIKSLYQQYAYAILRVTFIIVVVLYNWTESTIKPMSTMTVILFISILEVPKVKNER